MLKEGMKLSYTRTVSPEETAAKVASGTLDVYRRNTYDDSFYGENIF